MRTCHRERALRERRRAAKIVLGKRPWVAPVSPCFDLVCISGKCFTRDCRCVRNKILERPVTPPTLLLSCERLPSATIFEPIGFSKSCVSFYCLVYFCCYKFYVINVSLNVRSLTRRSIERVNEFTGRDPMRGCTGVTGDWLRLENPTSLS